MPELWHVFDKKEKRGQVKEEVDNRELPLSVFMGEMHGFVTL